MNNVFKSAAAAAAMGVSLIASLPAHATYVTSITIKNALPSYLQIAELKAFKYGSATNIALTGTPSALSFYNPSTLPGKAIDGDTGGDFTVTPGYHSLTDGSAEYFTIDFGAPVDLQSFEIYGRTDNNGGLRDYYSYALFDGVAQVGSGTLDARTSHFVTASFASSVPEAATWAMMLAGFGMVGAGMRSRRKQPVRVTYA